MTAPKRARHWANDLTDAWVAGHSVDPILAMIPANDQALARAHARIHAENILHHAKHTQDLAPLGEVMAGWVEKYRARRRV